MAYEGSVSWAGEVSLGKALIILGQWSVFHGLVKGLIIAFLEAEKYRDYLMIAFHEYSISLHGYLSLLISNKLLGEGSY